MPQRQILRSSVQTTKFRPNVSIFHTHNLLIFLDKCVKIQHFYQYVSECYKSNAEHNIGPDPSTRNYSNELHTNDLKALDTAVFAQHIAFHCVSVGIFIRSYRFLLWLD